jgi:hypothetical protein
MKLYRSYNFRAKDPAIDALRTVMQDEGLKIGYATYKQIEEDGGPAAGTMYNWFQGKTRRPQNAALEAAGRAMGFQRVWQKMKNGK